MLFQFWSKWIKGLENKPDNSLTMLDYRLKKFLKNLGFNSGLECEEKNDINNLTIAEIDESLKKVKEERSKNKLEMDELDYTAIKLKKQIMKVKNQLKEKKRLYASLEQKHNYLIKRRKMLESVVSSLNSTASNKSN